MCERGGKRHAEERFSGRTATLSAIVLIILLVPVGNSHSGSDSPAFRPDMKALGMGGAFVAAGNTTNALVYNPALLTRAGFDIVVPGLRFRVDRDFWDVASFIVDHQEDFALYDSLYACSMDTSSLDELDEFLEDITPYEDRRAQTRFAPTISFSLKNFGLGVYNTTDIWIKVDRGIYNPRVYGQAVSDLVFLVGYAQPIRDRLAVGLTGKYISRRSSGMVRIEASDLGGTNEILTPAYDELREEARGGGLDLGVLYTPQPLLDFGFVLQDAVGQIGGRSVPSNLKAGVAYRWQTLPWLHLGNGMLTGDVEDLFFTSGGSAFNRLHFGGSTAFLVFDLRAGFNRGYPSVGIGLDLFMFKINYAYYGEEYGRFPGQKPEWFHTLELAVGW